MIEAIQLTLNEGDIMTKKNGTTRTVIDGEGMRLVRDLCLT